MVLPDQEEDEAGIIIILKLQYTLTTNPRCVYHEYKFWLYWVQTSVEGAILLVHILSQITAYK